MRRKLLIAALCGASMGAYAITSPVASNTTITGTDSFTGLLAVNSNVILTIGEIGGATGSLTLTNTGGYPMVNNGRIVVNAGSSLAVNRTDAVKWAYASYSGSMDIYGSVTTSYGSTATDVFGYNLAVGAGKTLNVFSGGTLTYGNGSLAVQGGTANFYAGSLTKVDKLVINGSNGKIVVGADGVLTNTSGGTISELTVGSNQSNTRLDVSATTNFSIGNFTVQQGTSFGVILPSASGAIFTLGKFSLNPTLTYLGTETFTLEDFANDIFKISDSSNLNIIDKSILEVTTQGKTNTFTLIAKDSEGQTITLAENQTWEISESGFLNIVTVVPEPAEWAAIFGAAALALAFVRRRK